MLATLLGGSGLVGATLVAGLVALGLTGVAGVAAIVAGSLTACVFFLLELRQAPLSSLLIVALAMLSVGSFLRASIRYLRQQRHLATLPLRTLTENDLPSVRTASPVYLVPATRPAAFCFGLRRPRVVITAGLLSRLDLDELEAALVHEARHVRAREPLKCLLARLAAATFFWLPAVADLFARYMLVKELDADRFAVQVTSRRALVGALSTLIGESTPTAAVGLADFAAARVDRLLDPGAKLPPLSTVTRLAISLATLATVALTTAFPARIDLSGPDHVGSMLTSMSLHGLPGMAGGLLVNGLILALVTAGLRRAARK